MASSKPKSRSRSAPKPAPNDPIEWLFRAARGAGLMVRTWQGCLILAVIAAQLLLPLHYYTARRDLHDERFAWRMFSPTRMTTCAVSLTADGEPVNPDRWFQQAWSQTAARGRRGVIEAMAAHLCKKHEVVTARVSCTEMVAIGSLPPPPPGKSRYEHYRGEPQPMGGSFNMCEIPEL
jgi:hypothetical protein